ncbi:MAG: IS66 family transposase, partial [Myxococcaceae bacterium]|nr:IS66 family transposase [Myxococcaceae bacterium]
MLEMLRVLLDAGQKEDVINLVKQLVARNEELERKLGARMKVNEGVSRAQLLLLLDELQAAGDEARGAADEKLRTASGIDAAVLDGLETEEPPKRPSLRKPAPPQLRRVQNPLKVPDEERPCPTCGAERQCIGHDTTEVIELIPAELVVRQDMQEKLVCRACDGTPVRAPGGDKVVSGGKFGTTFVATLLADKYHDALPLNRQRQRFAGMGLEVSNSTLADQVTWGTDCLRPLWKCAQSRVLGAGVMHLDGTPLPVLDDKAAGNIKLGSLWGYVGVDGDVSTALYLYCSTGKAKGQRPGELGPEDMLALREGPTVADASSLFDAAFKRLGILECGCNMHGRRSFAKALDAGDTRAFLPLAAFKRLYDVEEEVRGREAAIILAARQRESRPDYDELLAWVRVHKPHEPPSSMMGKALQYLTNHQVALTRFLDDGRIPIDNGAVERLHIRAAMTRKTFLFAGSDAGGERAAIAYTVLASCALADVNPVEYLADVLPRLARRVRLRDIPALMPAAWKQSR